MTAAWSVLAPVPDDAARPVLPEGFTGSEYRNENGLQGWLCKSPAGKDWALVYVQNGSPESRKWDWRTPPAEWLDDEPPPNMGEEFYGQGVEDEPESNDRLPRNFQWPAPVPLFDKMPPPVLDVRCLPSALQAFVADQSDLVGSDPGVIALSTLVCCAAVIDDRHLVQPKTKDPTWTESARIWGAIVGDPSTKKTPAISKAIRPLRKMDIGLCQIGTTATETHALAEKVYQNEEAVWVRKGKKAGEPSPIRPPRPDRPRLIVEDITVEALSEVLIDNPRGVLSFQDELSGWFGAMDAYGQNKGVSKDRAHWIATYNGGPRPVDRIGRGRMIVPNMSTCILGGIQPEAIRAIKGKFPEDGLLQRFMVVCAGPAHGGIDRSPDMQAMELYRNIVQRLYDLPVGAVFTLSPAANAIREEVSKRAYELVAVAGIAKGLASWFGKWDGLFARLLLTYWLTEWAGMDTPPEQQIDGVTAARVRDLMFHYLMPHALTFYVNILDVGNRQETVKTVARYILSKGADYVTTRDLIRNVAVWGGLAPWEQKSALETLQHAGWIEPTFKRANLRTGLQTRYAVNPMAHKIFAAEAERERHRRSHGLALLREALAKAKPAPKSEDFPE